MPVLTRHETACASGANLETAQRLQPDIIVLDVQLPNVDSLAECREMTRANPKSRIPGRTYEFFTS